MAHGMLKMRGFRWSSGVALLLAFLARACNAGQTEEPTMWKDCAPLHPQQHFCHSDFVILGKVLSQELVPVKDTTEERETASTVATAAATAADTAASTTIATNTMATDAAAHTNSLTTNRPSRSTQQPASLGLTPYCDVLPQMSLAASLNKDTTEEHKSLDHLVKYKVKINKIYKGPTSMANGNRVIVHSKPEKLFGEGLQLNEEYILSGNISEGDFFHHRCDWRLSCHQITATIHQQLRRAYPRHCHSCSIKTIQQAPDESMDPQPYPANSTQCVYNPHYYRDRGLQDCEGLYSTCKRTPQGTCSWSRHQKMRECDSKRKKSLRGNNVFPNKNTSPDGGSSQIMPKKEQKQKRNTDIFPMRPADKKTNIPDAEDRRQTSPSTLSSLNQDLPETTAQGTASITTGQMEVEALPSRDQDSSASDQAPRDSSPFFTSYHVHMPHHAMGLPPPPVAGQEASNILDKITKQHLQRQGVESKVENKPATTAISLPHRRPTSETRDLNTSITMQDDLKTNFSVQVGVITKSSNRSTPTPNNQTNNMSTVQPTTKPNQSIAILSPTANGRLLRTGESSGVNQPHFPPSGDDPLAVPDGNFRGNPFEYWGNPLDSKKPDMVDTFPHPPVDRQDAKGILERITNRYRQQKKKS